MNRKTFVFTIITLITIISWIFFSIIRELNNTQVGQDIIENTKPINSTFDEEFLKEIYKRNSQ